MSLTFGPGPFSSTSRGLLSTGELPRHTTYAEPYPRRVRAFRAGRVVVDTQGAWMLHTTDRGPELWFPEVDVHRGALPDGALRSFPPAEDPVARALRHFTSVDPEAVDRWFLEDEPVYAHVRDPYHRVDVLSSHRHVVVEHAGVVIADTVRPKMLFETGLPPVYYVPWADVRLGLLKLSDTVTECPYKGDGQHWHVTVGQERLADAAWSLPHPLAEGAAAAEHVSFYTDAVSVSVDGVRLT